MLFVDIKDFKCTNCGCNEYQLIDANTKTVVCEECGNPIDKSLITITEIEK